MYWRPLKLNDKKSPMGASFVKNKKDQFALFII